MKRYLETDLNMDQQINKYKVTVDLYIQAESADDACEIIKDLIEELKIDKIDKEGDEKIHDYDITECEPAEIEF